MTAERYDAIVVGVGAMGSAAVYQLARRGQRVLGLERFDIPHDRGSSHGVTRIIRQAYYEHPSYVPLLRRAYELWRELEAVAGEQLLHVTGSIDAGPAGSEIVEGSRRSCELHDLPHAVLAGDEINRRFPGFHFPPGMAGNFQPDGGFLLPERCIVAQVSAAQTLGAEVHAREKVIDWTPRAGGVQVRTDRGTYDAGQLVLTAGAWIRSLLAPLAGLATPERQVLGWFQPRHADLFQEGRFPVFIYEDEEGSYYGLPIFSVPGVKVGRHHHLGELADPDHLDREIHDRDEAAIRSFIRRFLPDADGPTMGLKACMYTNSPDHHFIMGLHPEFPQVSFAGGFSGHGFKFSCVVGEILADLATRGVSRHDISFFRLDRFRRSGV